MTCHNINRFFNRLDKLKLFLVNDCRSLDIHCLSETFLTKRIYDSFLSIAGNTFVRTDRLNKKGGALFLYVREGISYKRSEDVEGLTENMY